MIKTFPLVLLGMLVLGVSGLAAPALATPPGCHPGPLPGTCCPPNADCACLLCNVGCTGLVPCQASPPVTPACETLTKDTWAAGVTWYNCVHVSGYVCTDPAYYGGGPDPLNNFVCKGTTTFVLP